MGNIKRWLCGIPPFLGKPQYLVFGSEFHSQSLEKKKTKAWKQMMDEEQKTLTGMLKSLDQCKLFTDNLPGAIIERTLKLKNAFGIHGMHGTLDINKKKQGKRIIIDLKTTSEVTEDGFIKKSIKLGYPRQGVVYEELPGDNLPTETYFIGISKKNTGTEKKPIYPLFIFDLNNYDKEKSYSEEEAKFLLTFYSKYGLPIERKRTTNS